MKVKIFDRTKANKVRDVVQANALKQFKDNNRVLLEWATGSGKTLASLRMIKYLKENKDEFFGYIICKEHGHISNWEQDIDKHNLSSILDFTDIFLYDSLHKCDTSKAPDFIVLDECHAITERRLDFLMDIISPETAIIMLSATVNDEKKELLHVLCRGRYVIMTITISEAIENGLLPPPVVYVHMYSLNTVDKNKVYVMAKGSKNSRIKVFCDFNNHTQEFNKHTAVELHVRCTEEQYYNLLTREINKAKSAYFSSNSLWLKNKWVNLGSQRKRFMSETKSARAKLLLKEEFQGHRFICFTGSKKQCEALGGSKFVHSDLKSKEVVSRKDDFNDGKIDQLFVVNMFRESVNLVNVEKGLIVQLDNVKLTFIQMLGRVFRSDFPEMHIMVLKGTRDEQYYKNVVRGFNSDYVTIINH